MNFPPDFYWKNHRLQKLALCKIYNDNKRQQTDCTDCATESWVRKYFAPLYNPIFTGTPQAPTPSPGDNSTTIATTEFVQNIVSGYQPKFTFDGYIYSNSLSTSASGPIYPTPTTASIATISPFYINFSNSFGGGIPYMYYIICNVSYQFAIQNKNSAIPGTVQPSEITYFNNDGATPPLTDPVPVYCKFVLQVVYDGTAYLSMVPRQLLSSGPATDLVIPYSIPAYATPPAYQGNLYPFTPVQFDLVDTTTNPRIKVQFGFPLTMTPNPTIGTGGALIKLFASLQLDQCGGNSVGSTTDFGINNTSTLEFYPSGVNLVGQYYLSST